MYLYAVKKPDEDLWLIFNGRAAGQWAKDLARGAEYISAGKERIGKVCSTLTWNRDVAVAKAAEVNGEVDAFQLGRLYGDDYQEAMGKFD